MTNSIITLLSVFALVFVVCSLVGIFRARSDIRKNKSDDNFFRPTRKQTINQKMSMDSDSAYDVLSAVNSLSDEQKAEFQRQLFAKFQK